MFSISTHTLTHFGLPISNSASGLYRPLSLSVFVDTSCLHSLRAAHFKSKLKTLCPGEVPCVKCPPPPSNQTNTSYSNQMCSLHIPQQQLCSIHLSLLFTFLSTLLVHPSIHFEENPRQSPSTATTTTTIKLKMLWATTRQTLSYIDDISGLIAERERRLLIIIMIIPRLHKIHHLHLCTRLEFHSKVIEVGLSVCLSVSAGPLSTRGRCLKKRKHIMECSKRALSSFLRITVTIPCSDASLGIAKEEELKNSSIPSQSFISEVDSCFIWPLLQTICQSLTLSLSKQQNLEEENFMKLILQNGIPHSHIIFMPQTMRIIILYYCGMINGICKSKKNRNYKLSIPFIHWFVSLFIYGNKLRIALLTERFNS